ncbi:MAG: hypothetical protein KME31_37655 [Tolypothrix carrinoi HA7290-LM1]|nr:hypothetical protein [Tolypothrix carrinoi HA7290-LM1]
MKNGIVFKVFGLYVYFKYNARSHCRLMRSHECGLIILGVVKFDGLMNFHSTHAIDRVSFKLIHNY